MVTVQVIKGLNIIKHTGLATSLTYRGAVFLGQYFYSPLLDLSPFG